MFKPVTVDELLKVKKKTTERSRIIEIRLPNIRKSICFLY